jgi:predicted MPP superfamily phosphohydrolase
MNIKKLLFFVILLIFIVIFFYFENNILTATNIELTLPNLPKEFNEYKIVQISDLHGKEFGKDNIKLITKIKEASPDLIFITGDFIDSNKYKEEAASSLIDKLKDISPIYFVTGNHEVNTLQYFKSLEKKLYDKDINILKNTTIVIKRNTDSITLIGIDDPQFAGINDNDKNEKLMSKIFYILSTDFNDQPFKILLTHRPEQLSLYSEYNIDLVFSGHAHGGQIRLPFIGGLFVPNQGFFPKYTSGKYVLDSTTMIVSRGLGNMSWFPRIFNRPEIIVTTLYNS